jgi:hypothetical protein
VPVQLIIPTLDVFLSPRLHDGLERWAPQLTRRTLPAKHWVPRTHPNENDTVIGEFGAGLDEPVAERAREAPGR